MTINPMMQEYINQINPTRQRSVAVNNVRGIPIAEYATNNTRITSNNKLRNEIRLLQTKRLKNALDQYLKVYNEFISKAEKESMNASKFLYGLIQLDDIPEEVLKSALIGLPYTSQQPVVAQNTAEPAKGTGTGKDVRNVGFTEE